MDVAEEDVAGQVAQIPRMTSEMRPGFDQFGAEDPQQQGCYPWFGRIEADPGHVEQGSVNDQGEIEQGCDMDGVDAPPLRCPDLAGAEAPRIASPCGTGPSHTLREEFGVFAHSCLYASFFGVLDPNLVIMLDHPPSYEVIVVRVQRTKIADPCIKVLVFESGDEGFVVEDVGAMGRSTTRHYEHTSIDSIGCCYLKIVSFQVRTAEKIPVAPGEV